MSDAEKTKKTPYFRIDCDENFCFRMESHATHSCSNGFNFSVMKDLTQNTVLLTRNGEICADCKYPVLYLHVTGRKLAGSQKPVFISATSPFFPKPKGKIYEFPKK